MTVHDISEDFPEFKKNLKKMKRLQNKVNYLSEDEFIEKSNDPIELKERTDELEDFIEKAYDNPLSDKMWGGQKKPEGVPDQPEPVKPVLSSKPSEEPINVEKPETILPSNMGEMIASEVEEPYRAIPNEKIKQSQYASRWENVAGNQKENDIVNRKLKIEDLSRKAIVDTIDMTWAQFNNLEMIATLGSKKDGPEIITGMFAEGMANYDIKNIIDKEGLEAASVKLVDILNEKNIDSVAYASIKDKKTEDALKNIGAYSKVYGKTLEMLADGLSNRFFSGYVTETKDPYEKSIIVEALEDMPDIDDKEIRTGLLKESIKSRMEEKYGDKATDKVWPMIERHIENNSDTLYNNTEYRTRMDSSRRLQYASRFSDFPAIKDLASLQSVDSIKDVNFDELSEADKLRCVNKFVAELQLSSRTDYNSNSGAIAAKIFGPSFAKYYNADLVRAYYGSSPKYGDMHIQKVNGLIEKYNEATGEKLSVIPIGDYKLNFDDKRKNYFEKLKEAHTKLKRTIKDQDDRELLDRAMIVLDPDNYMGESNNTNANYAYFLTRDKFFKRVDNPQVKISVSDILLAPGIRDPILKEKLMQKSMKNTKRNDGTSAFKDLVDMVQPLVSGKFVGKITPGSQKEKAQQVMDKFGKNLFVSKMTLAGENPDELVKILDLMNEIQEEISNDFYKIFATSNAGEFFSSPVNSKAITQEDIQYAMQLKGDISNEISEADTNKLYSEYFAKGFDSQAKRHHLAITKLSEKDPEECTTEEEDMKINAIPFYMKFSKLAGTKPTSGTRKAILEYINLDMISEMKKTPFNFMSNPEKIKDPALRYLVDEVRYMLTTMMGDEEFLELLETSVATKEGLDITKNKNKPIVQAPVVQQPQRPVETVAPPAVQEIQQPLPIEEEKPVVQEAVEESTAVQEITEPIEETPVEVPEEEVQEEITPESQEVMQVDENLQPMETKIDPNDILEAEATEIPEEVQTVQPTVVKSPRKKREPKTVKTDYGDGLVVEKRGKKNFLMIPLLKEGIDISNPEKSIRDNMHGLFKAPELENDDRIGLYSGMLDTISKLKPEHRKKFENIEKGISKIVDIYDDLKDMNDKEKVDHLYNTNYIEKNVKIDGNHFLFTDSQKDVANYLVSLELKRMAKRAVGEEMGSLYGGFGKKFFGASIQEINTGDTVLDQKDIPYSEKLERFSKQSLIPEYLVEQKKGIPPTIGTFSSIVLSPHARISTVGEDGSVRYKVIPTEDVTLSLMDTIQGVYKELLNTPGFEMDEEGKKNFKRVYTNLIAEYEALKALRNSDYFIHEHDNEGMNYNSFTPKDKLELDIREGQAFNSSELRLSEAQIGYGSPVGITKLFKKYANMDEFEVQEDDRLKKVFNDSLHSAYGSENDYRNIFYRYSGWNNIQHGSISKKVKGTLLSFSVNYRDYIPDIKFNKTGQKIVSFGGITGLNYKHDNSDISTDYDSLLDPHKSLDEKIDISSRLRDYILKSPDKRNGFNTYEGRLGTSYKLYKAAEYVTRALELYKKKYTSINSVDVSQITATPGTQEYSDQYAKIKGKNIAGSINEIIEELKKDTRFATALEMGDYSANLAVNELFIEVIKSFDEKQPSNSREIRSLDITPAIMAFVNTNLYGKIPNTEFSLGHGAIAYFILKKLFSTKEIDDMQEMHEKEFDIYIKEKEKSEDEDEESEESEQEVDPDETDEEEDADEEIEDVETPKVNVEPKKQRVESTTPEPEESEPIDQKGLRMLVNDLKRNLYSNNELTPELSNSLDEIKSIVKRSSLVSMFEASADRFIELYKEQTEKDVPEEFVKYFDIMRNAMVESGAREKSQVNSTLEQFDSKEVPKTVEKPVETQIPFSEGFKPLIENKDKPKVVVPHKEIVEDNKPIARKGRKLKHVLSPEEAAKVRAKNAEEEQKKETEVPAEGAALLQKFKPKDHFQEYTFKDTSGKEVVIKPTGVITQMSNRVDLGKLGQPRPTEIGWGWVEEAIKKYGVNGKLPENLVMALPIYLPDKAVHPLKRNDNGDLIINEKSGSPIIDKDTSVRHLILLVSDISPNAREQKFKIEGTMPLDTPEDILKYKSVWDKNEISRDVEEYRPNKEVKVASPKSVPKEEPVGVKEEPVKEPEEKEELDADVLTEALSSAIIDANPSADEDTEFHSLIGGLFKALDRSDRKQFRVSLARLRKYLKNISPEQRAEIDEIVSDMEGMLGPE